MENKERILHLLEEDATLSSRNAAVVAAYTTTSVTADVLMTISGSPQLSLV